MKISANGLDIIRQNEGFTAVPYPDGSGASIGYGHNMPNCTVNTAPIQEVTTDEANGLMLNDLIPVEGTINNNFNYNLTGKHFDALADFGYNSGSGNLQKAINYLLNDDLAGCQKFIIDIAQNYEQSVIDRHTADANALNDFTLGGVETIKANAILILITLGS